MKRNTSILILILGLGLGLRLWGVNQSLWLDEASQAQQSVLPIKQIWSGRVGDFHPPLFYLMAHAWRAINPFHIYFSQEFRINSLLGPLCIGALLLFVGSSCRLLGPLPLMLYSHY